MLWNTVKSLKEKQQNSTKVCFKAQIFTFVFFLLPEWPLPSSSTFLLQQKDLSLVGPISLTSRNSCTPIPTAPSSWGPCSRFLPLHILPIPSSHQCWQDAERHTTVTPNQWNGNRWDHPGGQRTSLIIKFSTRKQRAFWKLIHFFKV